MIVRRLCRIIKVLGTQMHGMELLQNLLKITTIVRVSQHFIPHKYAIAV